MMQQIKWEEEYVKGRKRTEQPEEASVSDYARSWCFGLEAFPCPSGGCAAKEVHAAKEFVLVLSTQSDNDNK